MVSKPSSPATDSGSSRLRSWLTANWDLVVLLLLVLASIPPVWFSPQALVVVRDTSLIDDNWHLDEVFKLSRNVWVGRDVAFTHGPIFQWLSSVPARLMGMSMGAIYATWVTVPAWCGFVFVYLMLSLLLPRQPAWKRALLLLLVIVFWEPSLRNAYPVLLFAIFIRGWYAVIEGRARAYALGIVAAFLLVTAFLIASDTGVYSSAAWGIVSVAVLLEPRRDEGLVVKVLITALTFVLSALVLVLTVNAAMGRALDFRFWKDSAQMVSVYRWATPAAMTDVGTFRLLGTFFAGAAVFLIRWRVRNKQNRATTERSGFLLSGFAFALVMLQSALVRSDYGHIVIASFGMVLLAGTILFSFESRFALPAVLLAFACSVLFSRAAFGPSTFTRLVSQVRHPLTECPSGFQEFDRGCFAPEFVVMLQSASSYLGQRSALNQPIVVFPYQTKFGIAAHRTVAGGLMQAYTASGPHLSQLEIEGLEKAPAPAGLYLPDADMTQLSDRELVRWRNLDLSLPVDGTYNFTRAPEVWFWMLQHYRADGQLSPGVLGLQSDRLRASRVSTQAQTLGLATQTYPIKERSSIIDLGVPDWPAGSDFLRLRLTVRYPFWWKLRKPERLQLEISRADGSSELRWFVLQPNASTDLWFYPWSPPDLAHYFDSNEDRWRPSRRSGITRLRIVTTPLDWVSVTPEAISVEAADAVRLAMSQQ